MGERLRRGVGEFGCGVRNAEMKREGDFNLEEERCFFFFYIFRDFYRFVCIRINDVGVELS